MNTGAHTPNSLFNRVRMGYAVIESKHAQGWLTLLGEGLGMQAEILGSGAVGARMDDHQRRFLVVPGAAEDLVSLGLEFDTDALALFRERAGKHGIELREAGAEESELRGVKRFWHFQGPKGLRIEVFDEPVLERTPPRLEASGFVTGERGWGHIGMSTRRPEAMKRFWYGLFDMRLTDELACRVSGVPLQVEFMRFNERHHSVAIVYTPKVRLDPIRTRIQHFEVQVASLDDLTSAYRRCRELDIPISMAVGRHANDKGVSFYVRTPSGFDIECTWDALDVDERTWKGEMWDRISDWGHQPIGMTTWDNIAQLARGVVSLARNEYAPAGF